MPENNNIMSLEGQLVGLPLAGPESFSAQQLDYLKRALGVDETVLWSNDSGVVPSNNTAFNTSESPLNFKEIRVYWRPYPSHYTRYNSFDPNDGTDGFTLCQPYKGGGAIIRFPYSHMQVSSTGLTVQSSGAGVLSIEVNKVTAQNLEGKVYKIVGVGRIAGGN